MTKILQILQVRQGFLFPSIYFCRRKKKLNYECLVDLILKGKIFGMRLKATRTTWNRRKHKLENNLFAF